MNNHAYRRPVFRRKMFVIVAIIVAAIVSIGVTIALSHQAKAPKVVRSTAASQPVASTQPTTNTQPTKTPSFDASRYSTSDPSSLWVVVNKQHPLSPIDYAPTDLTTAYGHQVSSRLTSDLSSMINDAAKDGANITLISSYRSYAYQVNLYNSYVNADGQDKADTYSARPGYSEHQTGLAIDFGNSAGTCAVEPCYAGTAEGEWLAAHAYTYGFLLRYTAEKQSVTGYEAEAWHYRYIGRELAQEMHARGVTTLEEFFNVTGGELYN